MYLFGRYHESHVQPKYKKVKKGEMKKNNETKGAKHDDKKNQTG